CHLGMCHGMDNPWKKMDPAAQLMLIDVQKRCLVQQPGSCRYLALSYTWEKTMDPFQTTMGNLQELSQCGAFDLPSNRSRLTTTILDSMTLTKELGLTYLWVDRFCIIQDDHAQKHTQLRAMASIYVNAYFTIAACGDLRSEYGLLGIDTERPRLNPFLRIQLSPTCRIISRLPQDEACSKRQPRLGYHTRGWTFQEWALPSRVLAFHHHTVSWLC
ncbi:HET-domain-containing protein, partial [Amniculicola lignicola CBS 123094]